MSLFKKDQQERIDKAVEASEGSLGAERSLEAIMRLSAEERRGMIDGLRNLADEYGGQDTRFAIAALQLLEEDTK